jgi:hypothetical protein
MSAMKKPVAEPSNNPYNHRTMKPLFLLVSFIAVLLLMASCQAPSPKADTAALQDPEYLHRGIRRLNDVVIYEIFSPPVASRIFSYASLSAYEAIRWTDTSYPSLAAQLNGFPEMPVPDPGKEYVFTVSAIKALFDITLRLTFTKDSSRITMEALLAELKEKGIDDETYARSVSFGEAVANAIWQRAMADQYKETRGMDRYTPSGLPGKWKNTPPDYLDAIEPFWTKMIPMVMDSSAQFKPVPPPPFDLTPGSGFYKEVNEVLDSTRNLGEEQKNIARFWDDNAAAVTHVGHMMFANKKPSPGGHWMNITALACRQTNADILRSAQAYAMSAITMYEAFISCWDEKYRSEYIRPVTAIHEHFDKKWQPLLQTPPFPEYTSGHSVVSSSVATVLTRQFGDNFAFTDDYELPYIGIKRSFPSFMKASEEACISRLYGGIHFRSAIDNGRKQGRELGSFILDRVKIKS